MGRVGLAFTIAGWAWFSLLSTRKSQNQSGGYVAYAEELPGAIFRRDLTVQYLIEAYRRLATGANRVPPSASHLNDIESALEDVQLFGTVAQVEAAHEFARNVAERGEAMADSLLTLLRDDLRKQLRLEAVKSRRIFLRFTDKKNK